MSDCSNDNIVNCESNFACKRLSLSRSVTNVSVVEKDIDGNEPVVSMDHVSIREDNTLLVYILWLAGIKNTADTVKAIQSSNAQLQR